MTTDTSRKSAGEWAGVLTRTGTSRVLRVLACSTAVLMSAAATAGSYATQDVAGWMVAASKDGHGCFVTKTFNRTGATTVLLGLDRSGGNRLSVLNSNWSIKPKDRLKLDFALSHGAYPKHFAIGIASDDKQGFVTNFEAQFLAYFAKSEFLNIARGDVPVERLNLAGSGPATVELKKCVAAQRARSGTDETAPDTGDIPTDPFAPRSREPKG
jgi:hypothetical protein